MTNRLTMLAIATAVVAGASTAALAQCPPGYALSAGACQPMAAPAPGAYAPNNPVSGAATGAAAGAAAGGAAAGPVGAVVGGALGTAGGALNGTANMLTPPRTCNTGYTFYNGACVPAR